MKRKGREVDRATLVKKGIRQRKREEGKGGAFFHYLREGRGRGAREGRNQTAGKKKKRRFLFAREKEGGDVRWICFAGKGRREKGGGSTSYSSIKGKKKGAVPK